MATVLQHLSAVAGFVAENLSDEDCKNCTTHDHEQVTTACEGLSLDLIQLSQRTERFMNGDQSEPIDKQGLN